MKTKAPSAAPSEALAREFLDRLRLFVDARATLHEASSERRELRPLRVPRPQKKDAGDDNAAAAARRRLHIAQEAERHRERLHAVLAFSKQRGTPLHLAALKRRHGLSDEEVEIAACAFWLQLDGERHSRRFSFDSSPREMARVLAGGDAMRAIALYRHFFPGSRLVRKGILTTKTFVHLGRRERLSAEFDLDDRYRLTDRVFLGMLGESVESLRLIAKSKRREGRLRAARGPLREDALLSMEKPKIRLADVVMPRETRERIETALLSFQSEKKFRREWGMEDFYFRGRCAAILLAGPPGTGKTLTARAVAGELRRPLATARYDRLFSVWFGESEKRVVRVFEEARKEKAVLLFDECDALVRARGTNGTGGAARAVDAMVNLLLQYIEEHDGVVLFTTNHADGLDPALDRRLAARIEFPLPTEEERLLLWEKHVPARLALAPDADLRALARRYALPGGYIKNAVAEAARTLATRRLRDPSLSPLLTMEILDDAARHALEQMGARRERPIGFG